MANKTSEFSDMLKREHAFSCNDSYQQKTTQILIEIQEQALLHCPGPNETLEFYTVESDRVVDAVLKQ